VRKDGLRAVATRAEQGWTLKENLTRLQPEMQKHYPQHLDPNLLAMTALMRNWNELAQAIRNYCRNNGLWERRGNRLTPTADIIEKLLEAKAITESTLREPYGDRTKVEINLSKSFVQWGADLRHVDFISAGQDGKLGTADDLRFSAYNYQGYDHIAAPQRSVWYPRDPSIERNAYRGDWGGKAEEDRLGEGMDFRNRNEFGGGGGRGGGMPQGAPAPAPAAPMERAAAPMKDAAEKKMDKAKGQDLANKPGDSGGGGFVEPARVRDWFPETLFWNPELITDAQGRAEIKLPIADSITTWRLTCGANSKSCLLGSATAPIRVFQDFFADIDFPVALTRNDIVWVPVAVFNYLKEAQTVRLQVENEAWFDLEDSAEKIVELGAGEIKAVNFKIRAKSVGRHALTVKASGTKLADALRRSVEVLPNGKRVEQVVNDRLPKQAAYTFEIPASSIEGGSKILFKVYPGVLAQIMDGLDGMLHMPGG